jgi:hypothetical protein
MNLNFENSDEPIINWWNGEGEPYTIRYLDDEVDRLGGVIVECLRDRLHTESLIPLRSALDRISSTQFYVRIYMVNMMRMFQVA